MDTRLKYRIRVEGLPWFRAPEEIVYIFDDLSSKRKGGRFIASIRVITASFVLMARAAMKSIEAVNQLNRYVNPTEDPHGTTRV